MSSHKGNTSRTRPQKYKNSFAFKNNLHDNSKKMKTLNSLEFSNVCPKCRAILEWKVKYKKYKPIKAAKTCCKCNERTIKEAYHTMCQNCSKSNNACPKCGAEFIENSKENNEMADNSSMTDKFNKLVLEKSNKKANESGDGEESDGSYDIESSSDYERDSESLISSDCDTVSTTINK